MTIKFECELSFFEVKEVLDFIRANELELLTNKKVYNVGDITIAPIKNKVYVKRF